MARKVHLQHVYNSDGWAENLFGCGSQIVRIQNTVVNAFHPHPKAMFVKFAGAYLRQKSRRATGQKLALRRRVGGKSFGNCRQRQPVGAVDAPKCA
jgi:hypothetical protein